MFERFLLKVESSETRYRIRDSLDTSFRKMNSIGIPEYGIIPLNVKRIDVNPFEWYINFDTEENMNKFVIKFL